MDNSTTLDPFSLSNNLIKRNLIGSILSSYSQPWDLMAELIQNSIDAIRRWDHQYSSSYVNHKHRIEIIIDSDNKSISLSDTGIGFDVTNIGTLLSLSGTDKTKRRGEIGEKGVGLKFAIFSSDSFILDTTSYNGHIKGTMDHSISWLCNEEELNTPLFKIIEYNDDEYDPLKTGTSITLNNISRYEPFTQSRDQLFYTSSDCIFNWSTALIEYVLRTKTAIGSTKIPFKKDSLNIDIILTHITNNDKIIKNIDYGYYIPEKVDNRQVMNFDYIQDNAGTWNDKKKISKLKGRRILFCYTDNIIVSGKPVEIRGLAYWVPKPSTWEDIQRSIDPIAGGSEDQTLNRLLPNSGIYISIKGMPTGVTINAPDKIGNAVWLKNVLFVIDVDHIDFDIGRKYIPGRSQPPLKDFVKKMFNKLISYGKYTTEGKAIVHGPTIKRETEFEIIKTYPNLNFDGIQYLKDPQKQEAAVVAIFHELLGAGYIKGYRGMQWSYQDTYDFYGYYDIPLSTDIVGLNTFNLYDGKFPNNRLVIPIIIEFKYAAEEVISNVINEEKSYSDIDLIVCWTINITKFIEIGFTVNQIEEDDVLYHRSQLEIQATAEYGGKSISVIVLKDLM